jgi:tetratricopeptide (TPR) repeat protein
MLLGPLAFFTLLEAGLYAVGFGRNTDFFIPDQKPGFYRTNPRFTELFFPASFGLKPLNFRITKDKPVGHFRIFVIGESAAMGVPEPGFGIAAQLRAQLQAAHPDKNLEVYNLGITAINSHVIRMIVRQSIEFRPDLLVFYMGNNEVVGPYGPGSSITQSLMPLPFIRAKVWALTTRTGQLLYAGLQRLGRVAQFKDWRGMEMFVDHTVAANDARLEGVYANFESNLNDMVEFARRAGIRTLLSTVVVNVRDSAPFASLHARNISERLRGQWEQIYRQAGFAIERGKGTEAEDLLKRALAIDGEHAATHYLLGKVLESRGEIPAARHEFLMALQFDALRFRADTRINDIIRRSARSAPSDVSLVDAAVILGSDADSTTSMAGTNLFFEHVHFNWRGNYEMGRLLAPAAALAMFGTPLAGEASLNVSQAAEVMGYTQIGEHMATMRMDELTARPPFSAQLDFADLRTRYSLQIKKLSEDLSAPLAFRANVSKIEGALSRDPSNPFLLLHGAAVNSQLGDFARALDFNDRLAMITPWSPEFAAQRSFLLQQLHRMDEAEETLLKSAKTEPYYFQTYGLLASLWGQTGAKDKALAFFKSLVDRMPEGMAARMIYARLLISVRQDDRANEQLRAVLRSLPDENQALGLFVERLYSQGRTKEALDWMLKAYAYNPRNFANNARLQQIYEEKGDLEHTVMYMRAMAESGPVKVDLHLDLAMNLLKLGHREEGVAELWQARNVAAAQRDKVSLEKANELIRRFDLQSESSN